MEEITRNDKLYSINAIKRAGDIDWEIGAGLIGTAFISGYFGLSTLSNVLEEGANALHNHLALTGATLISGSIFITWLALYIQKKVMSNKRIKEIRDFTGITKEEQREILETLVIEGDREAIKLFDYFYGEKARRSL